MAAVTAWFRKFVRPNERDADRGATSCGAPAVGIAEPASSSDVFRDERDGRQYRIVSIGSQVWMAENLAYRPNQGGCWEYDGAPEKAKEYGYLYDWETARVVPPKGWHLPTDEEWRALEATIGMSRDERGNTDYRGDALNAGGKLKSRTHHWQQPNQGAMDEYSFAALPGGYRFYKFGIFDQGGKSAFFWTCSTADAGTAYKRGLYFKFPGILRDADNKGNGFSVRCVKDSTEPVRVEPPISEVNRRLIEAAGKGDQGEIVAALNEGANVNVKNSEHGHTPLFVAACNGHVEVVRVLIAKGADVNSRSDDGTTALRVASYFANVRDDLAEVARILRSAGAQD